MKKTIKKMLSVLLIATMFMGFTVSALDITTDSGTSGTTDTAAKKVTNKGTITVTNVVARDTLSAYKILDAFYNTTTNVLTYDFTSDFKAFLAASTTYRTLTVSQYMDAAHITSGNISNGSTTTTGANSLDKLVSEYTAYLKTNSKMNTGTALTTNSNYATVSVEAGSYLILPTATTRVYAVMVGNVTLQPDTGNTWKIEGTSIVAKVSYPSIKKTIGDKTSEATSGSYSYGDTIKYNIALTVPTYPTNATNKKFTVVDTRSEYLTLTEFGNMVITDGESALTFSKKTDTTAEFMSGENKVATVTLDNTQHTITIDFDVDKINSGKININYEVKLANNAPLGDSTNIKNSAVLTYSNDPYDPSKGTTDTPSDETTVVTTYGIRVLKYDAQTGKSKPLQGAVFDVYNNDDYSSSHKVGTITTDASGIAKLDGVKNGTYYLKETRAPAGYTLYTSSLVVDATKTAGLGTDKYEDGYFIIEVPDTLVGNLPVTGGMGTILFTVSGAVLMIGAIWFIFVYKKNKKNQEA